MIPILADAIAMPGSVELAGWLGALFFLSAGANSFFKLIGHFKGNPPAEELKASSDVVAQRVDRLESDTEMLRRDMNSGFDKLAAKGDERRHAIYQQIDKLRIEVDEKLEGIHQRIHRQTEVIAELKGAFEISKDK